MSSWLIAPAGELRLAHPVEEAVPVGVAHQDHREVPDLAGLDQRQRLEQLVEGPEAAGHDHERVRVLHEHRLAGEEVVELDRDVDIWVEVLLVRQLDVAADRHAAGLVGPAVGGLHRARATARHDREPGVRELAADRSRELVRLGPLLDPRRPEHRDRRTDLGERLEALDELGQDPQRPPRVGLEERRPLGGAAREQLLVLGRPALRQPPGGLGAHRDTAAADRPRRVVGLVGPGLLRVGHARRMPLRAATMSSRRQARPSRKAGGARQRCRR